MHEGMEADDVIATARPARRRARARRLHLHRRQGRPPAPQRPDPDLQPPQAAGARRRRRSRPTGASAPTRSSTCSPSPATPSDNVPGVPGIGLKTGAKLLEEFGTLENLLANVDKVSGAKRKENLGDLRRDRPPGPAADHAPRRPAARPRLGRAADVRRPTSRRSRRSASSAASTASSTSSAPTREGREAAWDADYQPVDTPEALRDVPRRARPPAQVLLRHRDDLGRPAPRRPRRPLVLLEGGRGAITCPSAGPTASQLLDASTDARGPPAGPDRTRRPRRSARTSSTTCSCSSAPGSSSAGRSPTRWS